MADRARVQTNFLPVGDKRSALRFALTELHGVAPAPVDVIALPAGAPFGAVEIDVPNCTLCLSCVSACPTGALRDDPDQPMLRFAEQACVQCGLCQATCPEKVITLRPRLNFRAVSNGVQVLKAEEPFRCVRCHKPFGVKSTIDKVVEKLAGKHWMFKEEPGRLELIKMCDDCRVAYVTEREFDPHAVPRPPMRTTEDYLRERDARDPNDTKGSLKMSSHHLAGAADDGAAGGLARSSGDFCCSHKSWCSRAQLRSTSPVPMPSKPPSIPNVPMYMWPRISATNRIAITAWIACAICMSAILVP